MSDIKIADWEFLHAEQIAIVYLEHLQTAGQDFSTILGTIRGYALEDGEQGIVAALEAKAAQMDAIVETVDEIISDITGKAKGFIDTIDKLDDFVYGED